MTQIHFIRRTLSGVSTLVALDTNRRAVGWTPSVEPNGRMGWRVSKGGIPATVGLPWPDDLWRHELPNPAFPTSGEGESPVSGRGSRGSRW